MHGYAIHEILYHLESKYFHPKIERSINIINAMQLNGIRWHIRLYDIPFVFVIWKDTEDFSCSLYMVGEKPQYEYSLVNCKFQSIFDLPVLKTEAIIEENGELTTKVIDIGLELIKENDNVTKSMDN